MRESLIRFLPAVMTIRPHIYKKDGWWCVTLWNRRKEDLPLWHKAHAFKGLLQSPDMAGHLRDQFK